MKIAVVIGTSMLGLVLGTTAFAKAQHGHEDERQGDSQKQKGKQKEHGRSSAQPHSDRRQANGQEQRREPRPQEQSRAYQNKPGRQEPHRQQVSGPEHKREANRHEQSSRPRDVWQGHRAQHWQHEHHTWRERGGYRGYRIPEDRFRAHFGRGHWFRVYRAPIIVVDGYPRFQYGGFWFSLVDPWPEYWSSTWYETDDVYVDYVNDGYYMYNRRHPGVAIAVNVSF
ncbi:MAG: hypothetical protein LAO22_14005 [Acidobacteriia bacterium]|nr:hypothetical protein [Terriglobia bacterium]